MSRLIVASVQQRVYVPDSLDSYAASLRRFLRVAQNRQAHLVVFPELGGTMVALSLLDDTRSNLLKHAERGGRRDATLWRRFVGSLSGTLAGYLHADLRRSLAGLLDVTPSLVWDAYVDLFSGLAREYSMTLVAPSAYLSDPADGVVRNLAAVFSSSGELLGTQSKVVMHPADVDLAQPGATWDVIQTDVGRIGLIVGGDVLYPEVGRLLAYQGADVLVTQAASLDMAMYNKIRAGILARMQDNQLFAAASFLVGRNPLTRGGEAAYAGKSAVFAPQELTPRFNGVLVEMGGPHSEGVVAAEWDFERLRSLWESSDTPLRRSLSSAELGNALGQIYARLQRLPPVAEAVVLSQEGIVESQAHVNAIATLDDLTILDTYRRADVDQLGFDDVADAQDVPSEPHPNAASSVSAEDETDEYDSIR